MIRGSSGVCITRMRQCRIESAGRRKRATSEAKATEVCDVFIDEAKKTTKQLVGSTNSPMIIQAREACITDILSTGNVMVGRTLRISLNSISA